MKAPAKSFLILFSVAIFLFLLGCPFLKPNNPPSLSIPDRTVHENDDVLVIDLEEFADDPDNDPLTFEMISGDIGEVIGNQYVYQPGFGDAGETGASYEIQIKVSDWREGRAEDTFTITVVKVNRPPESPGNLSPEHGASGQPTDIVLSWECSDPDGDDLVYDVFFGLLETDLERIASSVAEASLLVEGLDHNVRYFWQIVARDAEGAETAGPIWGFRTVHAPEEEYLRDMIAVTAGNGHSVALREDGTVWTWGANEFGQLGDGTLDTAPVPVQVKSLEMQDVEGMNYLINESGEHLEGIIQVAAGEFHSVALKKDGTVWTWGCNWYGQLGDGTTESRSIAVQVKGLNGIGFLNGVIAVAAGGHHTIALKDDGTVWAWGYNDYGQLGNGLTAQSSTPVQVKRIADEDVYFTGVVKIVAGYDHTVSLRDDGTVWTWGRNHYGQLGDGNGGEEQYSDIPVQVLGPVIGSYLSGIIDIAAGWVHTVALRNDGSVWSWGRNLYGQLGNGTNTDSRIPVQVVDSLGTGLLEGSIGIVAGYQHTISLEDTGTIWTWGKNEYGQLGNGSDTNSTIPVRVLDSDGESSLSGIAEISGGWDHTIALRDDGTVWTWGRNTSGQLGNGEMCQYVNRSLPVQVIAPEDWYKKYF